MEAIRYLLSILLALMGIFYNNRINNIICYIYYKRYQVLFFFFVLCADGYYYYCADDKICRHILFFIFCAEILVIVGKALLTGHRRPHRPPDFLTGYFPIDKNKQLFLLLILWRKSAWILQETFLVSITNNINYCWYYGGFQGISSILKTNNINWWCCWGFFQRYFHCNQLTWLYFCSYFLLLWICHLILTLACSFAFLFSLEFAFLTFYF